MNLLRFKAAAPGSSIEPADQSPAQSNVVALTGSTGRSLGQRLLITAISFGTWPQEFLEKLFGFEIIDGTWCVDCVEVHPVGFQCPRALVADCDVCLTTVDLDSFGNCVNVRSRFRNHNLRNRRSKPRRLTAEVIPMDR